MAKNTKSRTERLRNLLLRGLIGLLLALPYKLRVPLCGWVMAYVIAPLAGYDKRVRDNLALIIVLTAYIVWWLWRRANSVQAA